MHYEDLDHLDSLISEDIISEEEDCDVSLVYSPYPLGNDVLNEAPTFTPVEDDIKIESSHTPQISYESDSSQKSEAQRTRPKVVQQNPNMTRKVIVSRVNDVIPSTKDNKSENVNRTYKLPSNGGSSEALLPLKTTILVDSKRVEDYSMLENKINDSLLDMLQGKVTKTLPKTVALYQAEEKEDESLKLITVFPSKNVGKTIDLMVKGKTCRSKQLLTAAEMRIVSRIVNQENMFGRKTGSYKNVYYDPESDTNIRYEVHCKKLTELSSNPSTTIHVDKNGNSKALIRNGKLKTGSDTDKLAVNIIARTRLGRISRPARHVIRDYKRLKYSSEAKNEADENKNAGGYSDYDVEDHDVSVDERESEKRDNYGPLEPSKRQVSPLSICPTCKKGYLGYRQMAFHFQQYPDHKDDKLLLRLLKISKEDTNQSKEICHEPLTNAGNKVRIPSNVSQTNPLIKKSKLNTKVPHQRSQSPAVSIEEFLSHFGAKDIAKYAGPVVAETMNSWEYLLMRGEKLKSGDGTLLISLLKELNVILAQIQAMSHTLEPLTKKNQFSSNKLMIGPEDVLQHVLGVKPGTYVISDSKPFSAPPTQKSTLSQQIPEKPQNSVQSTENNTAKLFDAVVAECLRDESADTNSNAADPNQNIDPKYQNMAIVLYKDPSSKAISTNQVPIFTTNDVPMSTQLVVPQTVQLVNNVNSPLVLDFNMFDGAASSNGQLSTNTMEPVTESASLMRNDSMAQNQPDASDVVLSMPSLTGIADESRNLNLEDNVVLDFSMLE